MVLPLYSVMVKIDSRIIEAAQDLGSNGWQILRRVMEEELTPLQLEYMTRHYFGRESMTQIARERGVNKSSVSRGIKNGRERIYRVLRYLDLRN